MHIRQSASPAILLIAAFALSGCDMITGADDKKNLDAEAIGYACRVSQKVPEVCMKENEAQSPTSILKGWKAADSDIEEQKIDPTMGKKPATTAHSAPVAVESESKAVPEKGAEKAAAATKDEKQAAAAKSEKPATTAKGEKPAAIAKGEKPTTTDKPDKESAEKKASH